MDQARRYFVTAAGVFVLGVALMFTSAGRVIASNISSVLVTNTSSNPVPTAAVGTTAVSGSVSIDGTPSVTVADTTTERIVVQTYSAAGSQVASSSVDVSAYKSLRVSANLFCFGVGAVSPQIIVQADEGFSSPLELARSSDTHLSETFDTPGTTLFVNGQCPFASLTQLDVAIYGRRN